MKIGFTGTRRGMANLQKIRLTSMLNQLLLSNDRLDIHYGMCVGADDEFCCIVKTLKFNNGHGRKVYIEGHPSDIPDMYVPRIIDKINNPRPPLDRNKNIVCKADMLIACPSGFSEILRSGTWSTVRYANKSKTPSVIIFPDGTTGSGSSILCR